MISKSIEKALNEQIAKEAFASFYYLSMASWCDNNRLPGGAKFFYMQSDEELAHMKKLFVYINETGGHAITPAIPQPTNNYKSIEEILGLTLKHEIEVTKSINSLVDMCLKEKDYSTFNFLQWYVAEQHEEEHLFQSIIDKVKLLGGDAKNLFWIDKELGSMTARG